MSKRQRTLSNASSSSYAPTEYYSQGSYSRRRSQRGGQYKIYKSLRGPTSYKTQYRFERVVEYDVPLNLNSGFNGNGYGISFAWTLDSMLVEFENMSSTVVGINGATDFQNLFDQWKIERVDMQIFFSRTQVEAVPSTTNFYGMPVFRYVSDYDDSDISTTVTLAQYPQCKTHQFGNGRSLRHICWYPGANTDAELDTGPSALAMNKRSPWLTSAVPGVVHHGIKVRNVPFDITIPDGTPDVTLGGVKFSFKIYYSMKLAK